MKLISYAFEHEGKIPSKYTCDGENINPPLRISEVPASAESLVLIMEDPDVPKHLREDGMWDHWVVFNMPTDITDIPEDSRPPGGLGVGTSGDMNYFGPCPPDREHRYFFKLYALDTELDLHEKPTKADVEAAMKGHVLEQTELMGRYERH
ncbi:MAG: YbhB/YbcL family Raf kinase inhibitor-like protein [Deltaproteobacteria bacterium]|jgi:Raf kinase inhibitor-like YbhB/YbcL family protein